MKVILIQDVKGLGKKGELVEASDGHARNFLIPRKLAVEANAANMNVLKTKHQAEQSRKERELTQAKDQTSRIKGATIVIKGKAGESGKLFGSITSRDIADQIKKQLALDVDKKKIVMDDTIKSIGSTEVEVKLYPEVSARFIVKVVQGE